MGSRPYLNGIPQDVLRVVFDGSLTYEQSRVLGAITFLLYRWGDDRNGKPCKISRTDLVMATGVGRENVSRAITFLTTTRTLLIVEHCLGGSSTYRLAEPVSDSVTTSSTVVVTPPVSDSVTTPVSPTTLPPVSDSVTHEKEAGNEVSNEEDVPNGLVVDESHADGREQELTLTGGTDDPDAEDQLDAALLRELTDVNLRDDMEAEVEKPSSYQTTSNYLDDAGNQQQPSAEAYVVVGESRFRIIPGKAIRGAFVVYEGLSWEVRLGMDSRRNMLRLIGGDRHHTEMLSADVAKLPMIMKPGAKSA
jgi:hypothetical protein